MLTKFEKSFAILFSLILIVEIICSNNASLQNMHYLTKPALLLSLIVFFWKKSSHIEHKSRKLIMISLCLSMIGDTLLMFVDKSPHYFTAGLITFLLAHIMYILVFLKDRNKSENAIVFIIFMLVYATGLFYFLIEGLGEMLIPVSVYVVVILSMATTAFLRQGKVSSNSFLLVFYGALLFMISDSILALNKFFEPLPFSNISIIFTYAYAQLLIVFGLLKRR